MKEPLLINEIRLPPGHSIEDLLEQVAKKAAMPVSAVTDAGWRIVRKSVDARRKPVIYLQYAVEIGSKSHELTGISGLFQKKSRSGHRPVVVGAGPAGLFAALALALAGQQPIVLEQGKQVEQRQIDVARFWQHGNLDPLSNVQFGEGGAGTFSDGKLTTGIKDPRCRAVLEEMVLAGAPEEILVLSRPHVGTDHLRQVVRGLREKIISQGGEFLFNSQMTRLQHNDDRITGLVYTRKLDDGRKIESEMQTDRLILAVGHSARNTFRHLADLSVHIEAKPFSIGVRVEHLQDMIDRSQYGVAAGHTGLPPADYKLACHLPSGRSVYTFCMCPGGQVVAASSEESGVVINGMSHFARNQKNANSALLVGVSPADFPYPDPLGGVFWQQEIEQKAYSLAGGGYRAPAQLMGDFLRSGSFSQTASANGDRPHPSYQPGVRFCELDLCLPAFISQALREALPTLDRKLNGFASPETVLTGVETRSSSPIRIVRDSQLQSSLQGLFPCGEGAGYAGGIMSAAVDGLRCAEAAL